jgi:hypothetical protein
VPFTWATAVPAPHRQAFRDLLGRDLDADARVLVRGTIDCIVLQPSGRATILEFKTGSPAPWHEEQVAVYVRAAQQVWPGVHIEARLVHADSPSSRGIAE